MTLKEKLDEDLKSAMKSGEELKVSVIRLLKSAIKNAEIAKIKKFSDDEVIQIIQSSIKQRKESIEQFKKANRSELVEKEEAEKKILENYLPEQLNESELRILIEQVIKETSATSSKEVGKVMGKLMPLVRGKANGSVVNQLVKEILK